MAILKKIIYILLPMLGLFSIVNAQVPVAVSSADIYMQLKKLNVLGSVLYIAAHPDDENNGFLPYLAKERMYRTGYLSLTRGDGGQNLIGSEQGVELGLIRTQELLAARKIDGAEQFFSSAYEFGFSKSASEALSIWDKQQVLADMVWTIRKFQPDILIARFPGDARAGHGHHWASALLANEAYVAAGDSTKFREQLEMGLKPWKAKRILWNGFNFGGTNTTVGMPIRLDVGGYDPLIGKSSGELGGEARSMHKSQGEGRPRRRGEIIENFTTTGGDTARTDIMDGVITDWTRFEDGGTIKAQIDRVIKQFNFEHPENSIDSLIGVYRSIERAQTRVRQKDIRKTVQDGKSFFIRNEDMWWSQKLGELKDIILNCSGIFAEATTKEQFVLKGDTATVTCFINNRSNTKVQLKSIAVVMGDGTNSPQQLTLNQNYAVDIKVPVTEPSIGSATQPYWLQLPQTAGNFTIPDPQLTGQAWNNALLNARFHIEVGDLGLTITRPVQYKYVDPVKGEVYEPFIMVPHIYFSLSPHVALMNVKTAVGRFSSDSIYIKYKSNFTQQKVPVSGYVLQDTIKTAFEKQDRDFEKGKSYTIALPVNKYYNAKKGEYIEAAIKLNLKGKDQMFTQYFKGISYDHIPDMYYSFKDRIKFVNEEVITTGKKIGYITGAGDKLPEALKEMHYDVKVLSEADLTESNLEQFDAIIIGIRAHNIYEYLSDKWEVLNNYVKNGGNLISQYIKSNTVGSRRLKLAPYSFTISAGLRVTEENAAVNFLLPQHPVLNYPNKITQKDFEGWIQERSTYQVDQADPHYEMPLGMNDTNEKQSNGSLAIAKYGKGNFAYVGLVLFRQLPAGIPGAYRLLANLIALPKN